MSLYVRKHSGGWSVIEEIQIDKQRKFKTIPKESYVSLSINPNWTIEEGRSRIREINLSRQAATKSKINASRNFNKIVLTKSVWLPENKVLQFLQELVDNSFGSKNHKKKLISHWQYLCKLIVTLQIEPKDYFNNKERIYKYFMGLNNSIDYVNKLLRIFNSWGEFICRDQAQFFKPVPKPRGTIRSKIEDTYVDSENFRGESDPLTPQLLQSIESQIKGDNYNWLLVTIWFGLRPNEVDRGNFKITYQGTVPILNVFQTKLTSVSRDRRWKAIPCFLPEQLQVLTLLNETKRPLMKTMRRVFKSRITLYGGRKGFVDLMLDRGQSLEDISMWLGHQSIETTWRKYRNKKRVSWKAS